MPGTATTAPGIRRSSRENGIKVVSATEVISDGAEGIILESMLEGFAEYYSVDLSEKVVRGMTDNALKCMFNGGTRNSISRSTRSRHRIFWTLSNSMTKARL